MAVYPSNGFPLWFSKRDNVDVVEASHVNMLQEELDATQRTLGEKILVDKGGTHHPTVSERLDNIEIMTRDVSGKFVPLAGGGMIDPPIPGTPGMGVVLPATETAPAIAVMSVKGQWATPKAALYPNGKVLSTNVVVNSPTSSNIASLHADNGLTTRKVSTTVTTVGGAVTIKADDAAADHSAIMLGTSISATGDALQVRNTQSSVRNALHVKTLTGKTAFLVDTDGNVTANSITVNVGGPSTTELDLDGVHLDKHGLRFLLTNMFYGKTGITFSSGEGLYTDELKLANGVSLKSSGANTTLTSPVTIFTGQMMLLGMKTYRYTVPGTLWIPIPRYSDAGESSYAVPRRAPVSPAILRDDDMKFLAPVTGRVKITLESCLQAFGSTVYLSYELINPSTGKIMELATDNYAVILNGVGRSAAPGEYVQASGSCTRIIHGLQPGKEYVIRLKAKSERPSKEDEGGVWTRAINTYVLIEPMLTTYESRFTNG